MAQFGAKYIKAALIKTEPDNAYPTYDAAFTLGALNKVTYTPNFNEAKAYGDDRLQEYVAEFKDSTIAVEVTDLANEVAAKVYGATVDEDGGYISKETDSAPYMGVAWIICKMVGGAKKFQGVYVPKCKGVKQALEANTKGDSITLSTGKVTFTGACVANGVYEEYSQDFDTEAAAKSWVDGRFTART